MELLGTTIQTLRRNKGMTQAQLAEILSVSSQSVSKWENNLSAPDVTLLPVIARYFGITMDELFHYRLDALNYKERFIRFMADNGALQFGSFRLQSGRISPYYIDTGRYRTASQITKLGEFYAACLRENNVQTNLLVGCTHREIPILISASMVLFQKYGVDVRYSIDRCVGQQPETGDRITLIKDTLTSGNTLRTNLCEMQNWAGVRVSDVVVAVDRMERGDSLLSSSREIEREAAVRIHAIVTLDDIIRAVEDGIVGGPACLDGLKRYRENYKGA